MVVKTKPWGRLEPASPYQSRVSIVASALEPPRGRSADEGRRGQGGGRQQRQQSDERCGGRTNKRGTGRWDSEKEREWEEEEEEEEGEGSRKRGEEEDGMR